MFLFRLFKRKVVLENIKNRIKNKMPSFIRSHTSTPGRSVPDGSYSTREREQLVRVHDSRRLQRGQAQVASVDRNKHTRRRTFGPRGHPQNRRSNHRHQRNQPTKRHSSRRLLHHQAVQRPHSVPGRIRLGHSRLDQELQRSTLDRDRKIAWLVYRHQVNDGQVAADQQVADTGWECQTGEHSRQVRRHIRRRSNLIHRRHQLRTCDPGRGESDPQELCRWVHARRDSTAESNAAERQGQPRPVEREKYVFRNTTHWLS